jgi:hypothetical protein
MAELPQPGDEQQKADEPQMEQQISRKRTTGRRTGVDRYEQPDKYLASDPDDDDDGAPPPPPRIRLPRFF